MQPNELKDVFRANFCERRQKLRLTQQELAERMNKPQPYVSRLEKGLARPMLDTLAVIADALETTPAKLLTPSKKNS